MSRDIVCAKTDEGLELAVIDVTNPAFAVSATDTELSAMAEQYIREAGQPREIPEALREALRNSMLGKGLVAASGTFLDGLSTYLLKLGPDNLGAEASPIDRRIAASFPAFAARMRLQDIARLLADGLASKFAAKSGRPLCLVNIGGGPASDSWNALIYLQAESPKMLDGREIAISVMDLDPGGPRFGGRALQALSVPGQPLNGLKIDFKYFSYEWKDAQRLQDLLGELGAGDSACGISSEGGLFEYGSDEEVVANLKVLRTATAEDAFVVGSVTRDDAPVRASRIASRVATRPRSLDGFGALCEKGGWGVERVVARPFSYHVRLLKS